MVVLESPVGYFVSNIYFFRFMNTMDMDQILDMSTNIIEIIKFEHNNRSTPMGYQTKPPIHFMLQNKVNKT